jgi:hypothetical protein
MQRDQQTPAEGLIELGQASVETRGMPTGLEVEALGYRHTSLED